MIPEQRELFRVALLRVLDANQTRFGLRAAALQMHVVQFGFTPDLYDVQRELEYLADKTWAAPVVKEMSPENKTWRITAAGRDWLASNG